MKFSKLIVAVLFGSLFFVSCDSNDDGVSIPLGVYEDGMFVLNEGSSSAGSVTFIGDDMVTVQQNVYGAENGGDGIGGYVQSMFFDGEKAFIISGSNKITVVNRYTFELIDKIETGLTAPRYGVVLNGKAYVTNQADFNSLTDDYIAVINLSTYEIESTIPVNAVAEKIIGENGKLYIGNGTYGNGTSVTVINPSTSAIVKKIDTGISPVAFEEANGVLYVLCSNYSDASKIVKINLSNNEISGEITFPSALVNAQNLDIEGDKMYFTVNSDVFSAALSATAVSATPVFTSGAMTLYGCNVKDSRVYITDARDYQSDGKAFIYSVSGALQNEFTVGLIPNGFYFN